MKAIYISQYRGEGETVIEYSISDLSEDEFDDMVPQVEVFDDGGSHMLVKYKESIINHLIKLGASDITSKR